MIFNGYLEQPWNAEQSQHPTALEKIEALEAAKATQPASETEMLYAIPTFTKHLNDLSCNEEENAKFECGLEPKNDPNMKIEWQLNGKPLSSGSRIVSNSDFGVISLDIQGVQSSDAGVITCSAINNTGKASTSGTLKVNVGGNIVSDTQHPAGKSGLDNINKVDEGNKSIDMILPEEQETNELPSSEKPIFTTSLPEKVPVNNGILHLECNVEPKNDPKLNINWYHNGLPLSSATRIMPKHDFGFVTLDINDMSSRDDGIYTCKAVNDAGEAVVFTTVTCQDQNEIDLDTKHPRGKEGLQAISDFETKALLPDEESDLQEVGDAPKFVQEFNPVTVSEGDNAFFEAQLEPKNDPNINLEWLFNGKPLQESSRYKRIHSFGIIIFEIGNVSSTDAGTYSCNATNKFGSATCSMNLSFQEEKSSHCPKFTDDLEDQLNLKDGESVHLECALEPINDPDLKVAWLFNDEPLPNSSRIKSVADFGYVMLDISGVDSRDTGKYTCRAWNK